MITRRQILLAAPAACFGQTTAVQSISPKTVRITIGGPAPVSVPNDGSLVRESWPPVAKRELTVTTTNDPLRFRIEGPKGKLVQDIRIDPETGAIRFALGDGPVLGLGEGGPQFDRRGDVDRMRSGQGGYQLRTHGGRVPIPWLIGTSGWGMFIHNPYGSFDLSGSDGLFQPFDKRLPIDIFVIGSSEPAEIMAEYARITGHPEMPPLWSLGYLQSHRTILSRDEILTVGRTFREKKLPCDAVIYLGTGFCPSGWNTANGSFDFNPRVFAEPEKTIRELHDLNLKVVVHSVILARTLRGTAAGACSLARFDDQEASCYWDMHRRDFAMGIDGWWPDEGDPLDIASRLVRIRMYWEGPQIDRPNERPFALHRNGYAGMQRYAPFLWSGDVYSTWETLRVHVPIGINTGLSGVPLWGTDIGGFVPTKEFTGELYVRWFQFGAFCPLFRSHGRSWRLRLPWQWNTGELGPNEVTGYGEAANPDPSELHNAQVEPICRKYLELRYRLMPYLYSAVRESHETGMPVMRALWLHYPDDPEAVKCGDQYVWGRDMLVAPVTEKGASSRKVYLPRGTWYDFWTNEKVEGGREIERAVDLETMPLYVRAGAVIPFGPLKQYTGEKVDGPLTLTAYPGADGACMVYEDDGKSFDYRRGGWMGLRAVWSEAEKTVSLRVAGGSRVMTRALEVGVVGGEPKPVRFDGRAVMVRL